MKLYHYIKKLLAGKPIKNFVSSIDRFLAEFDKKYPKKSASQMKEIKKYQRIFDLRDKVPPSSASKQD